MKALPLILAGGALLLLTSRKSSAAALVPNVRVVPVNNTAPTAPNPSAIVTQAGARILASLTNGLVSGKVSATTAAAANAMTEDARAAVRAGDADYGLGAWRWFAGNVEAAREAVRQGDPYYVGSWSEPNPASGAAAVAAQSPVIDGIVAAPVYDAAELADLGGGLIPAGMLTDWTAYAGGGP